jgi:hypothetical protein
MRKILRIAALAASWAPIFLSAQKVEVKIVNRQNNQTQYNYVVPGHATSTSNGNANCYGNSIGTSANVNCSGYSVTNTTTTAPRDVSFSVTGATFSLLLADGRTVVVNCVSKFAEHMAGPSGNHRSCRQPLVDDIEAEFKGKNAKLYWVVSLDGKKMESETYTILAVLAK